LTAFIPVSLTFFHYRSYKNDSPSPMETFTWPTKMDTFPISVVTLPVSRVIGLPVSVADAPAEMDVDVPVAVERSTVVVVSARRPGFWVTVVAVCVTDVPGLTVEVAVPVEVEMERAELCGHDRINWSKPRKRERTYEGTEGRNGRGARKRHGNDDSNITDRNVFDAVTYMHQRYAWIGILKRCLLDVASGNSDVCDSAGGG
jgi:hypothetical protein